MEAGNGLGFGQSVSFVNGATASALQLDLISAPIQSFGLSNWQVGDRLYIANGVTVTGASYTNGTTLQVFTSGGEWTIQGDSDLFAVDTILQF